MDKGIVVKNFSKHAHTYDKYADIQRRAARGLLGLIKKRDVADILEIGSGTGNYTLLLKREFANARIKAVDISGNMVEVAAEKIKDMNVEFMVGDAEDMDLAGRFNLITSNACFQWFEDLDGSLTRYKDLLKDDGIILFSIFGPETFHELNMSLGRLAGGVSAGAGNFAGRREIEKILGKNFKKVSVKEAKFKKTFSCVMDLLSEIKYTGTNGNGLGGKVFFTPRVLKRLEEIYLGRFRRIRATYQVFYCFGER
jgi:malonyl-CoA O-methyltransferase